MFIVPSADWDIILSCSFLADFLSVATFISTRRVHHGARMYGSIRSILSVVKGNWLNIFPRMERCRMTAVRVSIASLIHGWMGCCFERDCIRVIERSTLVCRRSHVGGSSDSCSMAAVGVVVPLLLCHDLDLLNSA